MLRNRRWFLKSLGAASAFMMVKPSFAMDKRKDLLKITVLHTNDLHSQIDAYSKDHTSYPGMGGFARRAAIVKQIREMEQNVLLLDAGDLFQGSPYFNFFKGELEIKLMNQLGYDAMTIGNHEFDNGAEMLFEQLIHANYPILSANYSFSDPDWAKLVKPYVIKTYGKLKVGIMGLSINPQGLILPDNFKGITYRNDIDVANETAGILKNDEGCDFIIALTHLGIKRDLELAKESAHIDLILGGHSHTFLEEPMQVQNKLNKNVLINQMGWAGVYLGRIDLYFGEDDLSEFDSNRIT